MVLLLLYRDCCFYNCLFILWVGEEGGREVCGVSYGCGEGNGVVYCKGMKKWVCGSGIVVW